MHLTLRSYLLPDGEEEYYCYYKDNNGIITEAVAPTAEEALEKKRCYEFKEQILEHARD